MASAWTNAKKVKMRRTGGKCEICGRDGNIGHHIVPQSKGGADCVNNCEIRCEYDEQKCHELFEGGNPPDWYIHMRHKETGNEHLLD